MAKRMLLVCLVVTVLLALTAGVALAVTKQCPDTNINDKCLGTRQDDTMLGNNSRSIENIYGLGGDDKLEGFGGFDALYGGGGGDRLLGGKGGDILDPGSGSDTLFGGQGGDLYMFEAGWDRDTIIDGAQDDRNQNKVVIQESVTSGLVVDLLPARSRSEMRTADGRHTANWTADTVMQDVGNMGRGGDDVMRGTNAQNSLESQDSFEEASITGADKIYAMGGSDFVTVVDKDGDDFVDCGEGNDTVYYSPGDTIRNCETKEEIEL